MIGKVKPININWSLIPDIHCEFPIFDKDKFPSYSNVKITTSKDELYKFNLIWESKWNSIMIISDLHFGNGNCGDNFVGNFQKFKDWIESYDPDIVILNGDIFDTWKFDFSDILDYRSKFVDYFIDSKKPRFLFLRGNHDNLPNTFDFIDLSMEDQNVLIGHFDQNDPVLYKITPKIIVKCLGLVEHIKRNAENPPQKLLNKWEKWKLNQMGIYTGENNISYLTRIMSESAIDSGRYNVIIHGHTHNNPKITDYGGGLIVDDGCCQKKARQGILLTKNGKIILINDAEVDTSY